MRDSLLIVSKQMISLYRDPKGENVFGNTESSSTVGKPVGGLRKASRTLSAAVIGGFEDSKVLIQKLENRVSQLKDELDHVICHGVVIICIAIVMYTVKPHYIPATLGTGWNIEAGGWI